MKLRLGKLEDAQKHSELAIAVAPAPAHELLAKIALARHDRDAALREAGLAQQADPTLPMPLVTSEPVLTEACLYTNTEDESFLLERRGRIVIGSACSGHGFKFAPAIGERLAALAQGAG